MDYIDKTQQAAQEYVNSISSDDPDLITVNKIIKNSFLAGAKYGKDNFTKFNIGDTVYCLCDNKVYQCRIVAITIEIARTQNIEYKLKYPSGGEQFYHSENVFASKEELLKSL